MITFSKTGVRINEEGWHAADPRNDSITIYFEASPAVTIDSEFIARAASLLNFEEDRQKENIEIRALRARVKELEDAIRDVCDEDLDHESCVDHAEMILSRKMG